MTGSCIQLYTLRDFEEPLARVIERVGTAGFDGVEFAHRFLEADPEQVHAAFEASGVEPVAAHVELSTLASEFDAIVERCQTVGCPRVVLPHIPAARFRTLDRIDGLAADVAELALALQDVGIDLGYHNTREAFFPPLDTLGLDPLLRISQIPDGGWNHLADYARKARRVDGGADGIRRSGFGRLLTAIGQGPLFVEVDVKNVTAAGFDPLDVYDVVGDRLELVHIADIARNRRFPPGFAPVDPGEGMVDLDRAIQGAHARDVEWLVYEHDAPTEPELALRQAVETFAPHFPRIADAPVTPRAEAGGTRSSPA